MIDLHTLANSAIAWGIRYLVVSTPLLLLMLAATRLFPRLPHRLLDYLWKGALIGSLAIATLLGVEIQRPAIATFEVSLPGPAPAAVERDVPTAAGAEDTSGPTGNSVNHDPAPQPMHWPTIITSIWVFGALAGLGIFTLRRTLLYRRIGKRVPVMDERVRHIISRLRMEARLARPLYVSSSQDLYSPIAIGSSEICLPEKAINIAKEDELEGMIAHELAHLVRRDPIWLTAWNIAIVVLFFQPLLLLARRRFQASAEYLCDSWAIQHTRSPEALVRCLVSVAEGFRTGAEHRLAVGMASSKRTLLDRARAALEERHDNLRSKALLWAAVAVVAIFGAALVAPSIRIGTNVSVVEPITPGEGKYPELIEDEREFISGEAIESNSHSFIVQFGDLVRFLIEPGNDTMPNPRLEDTSQGVWRGNHHEIWDDLSLSYRAEIQGVVLTNDRRRIHHIDPGGRLYFRIQSEGTTYSIEIRPEGDRLVRNFEINATPSDIQPQYRSAILGLLDRATSVLIHSETKPAMPARPTKATKETRAVPRARSATRVNPNLIEPGPNVFHSTGNGDKAFVIYYSNLLQSIFDSAIDRQPNPLPGRGTTGRWNGNLNENQDSWEYHIRFKEVYLTEDNAGIQRIEQGGYFQFSVSIGGEDYRIEIRPSGRGELRQRFWRNGRQKTLETADQEELQRILQHLVEFSEEKDRERLNSDR